MPRSTLKHSWFQFRLRTLFVMMILFALLFMGVAYVMSALAGLRYEWERRHSEAIERHEQEQEAKGAVP